MIRMSYFNGMAYLAAFLGVMCFLGVLAFHYPEYLTTPQLREIYTQAQVRALLYTSMLLTGLLAAFALFFSQRKELALLGGITVCTAWLLGGANVPYESPVETGKFYISLDWVLLDLLIIASLFISIEKFFRLNENQRILRRDWQLDLTHYVVNHIFNGGLVFIIYLPATYLQKQFFMASVADFVNSLPVWQQVFSIVVITDLAQYWIHRASHSLPFLWRFHKIHHSVEVMDWLAGSRLHLIDIIITRSLSLIPMVLLGFSVEAINIYLPLLALQSVFNHCNLRFHFNPLRKILSTPKFHHWHHTSQPEHINRNFSVSLPVFDLIFGTYYCPKDRWPKSYGLAHETIKHRYIDQLLSPFLRKQKRPTSSI